MIVESYLHTRLGTVKIRKATITDTKAFYAVLKNVSDWLDKQKSSQWIPGGHDNNIQIVEQYISDGTCYAVEFSGIIIATVRVSWSLPSYWTKKPDNVGYICALSVHRNFAGKSLGNSILEWAEQLIREHGKHFACLDCYAKNLKLTDYYESRGYKLVQEVETYPDYTQHLYQKKLE